MTANLPIKTVVPKVVGVHEGLPVGVSTADNEAGWRMALGRLASQGCPEIYFAVSRHDFFSHFERVLRQLFRDKVRCSLQQKKCQIMGIQHIRFKTSLAHAARQLKPSCPQCSPIELKPFRKTVGWFRASSSTFP